MIRRLSKLIVSVAAIALLTGVAMAQSGTQPFRIVILPFDTDAAVPAYQLGLPAALQHTLNQVPGLFVPPIGDAALMANKAADNDLEVQSLLGRVFNANALVTGRVITGGGGVIAEINVSVGGTVVPVQVQGAGPAELAGAAAEAVLRAVRPNASEDSLAAVRASAQHVPSVPSLGPTSLAASGLPGARVDQLNTASQLDSQSAWVAAEYARVLALAGDLDEANAQALRATQLAPNNAEVQALAGVVFEASGSDDALAAFERALSLNPAHAVALAGRATVNALSGQGNPAADLEASILAYPRFVDAYIRLANQQADIQRAVQTMRRAESYSPESVLLRGTVMQRLIDAGDATTALAYLRQTLSEPLARSASMYALVRLLPSSMAAASTELISQGLQHYPESLELQMAEADLLIQTGDHAAAIAKLSALRQQNPNSVGVANLLAVAQAESGDLEGARTTFEALRDQGVNVELALAELYLASGRASGALDLLQPMVDTDPSDAYLQALYGTALMRIGRLADGQQVLNRALELDPANELASRSLELLVQQRQLTGGDVTMSEQAGVAFQQGLSALDRHDYSAATEAFGRSRQVQDTGLGAFYQGYSRQLLGDTRAAVADYLVALEAFSDSDIVLNNLGYAQLELGRFDLAMDYLRAAVASNPSNPQAHLNLGVVYYALQRFEDAITQFAEAGRLDPVIAPTTEQLIEDVRRRLGEQ